MTILGHRPYYRGSSCVCANCGIFLFDVRTAARLRALTDVDEIKRVAVERRFSSDPELARRLIEEDLCEVVSTYKFADKLNDFLRNPKARPDLQTPEAQEFLNAMDRKNGAGTSYHSTKTDPLMPWLTREWKKGRARLHPNGGGRLQIEAGPDYEYDDGTGNSQQFHTVFPAELEHWGDWYGSDYPSRRGKDIMQIKAPELHQTIKDWDTDMREQAGGSAQNRGDVVHSYPDGWSVQQLTQPNQLEDEGEKMGHCVGSYAKAVQNGESLIYSLRDHHNEPHATWEVTPRWHEGSDGKLYPTPNSSADLTTVPSPRNGTMEQIQGKGNKPPVEDYQRRVKDFFEKQFPDPKDRPKWDDQHYNDLDEYMDEEGHNGYIAYHPGEYGLEQPKTTHDWPEMTQRYLGWGEYEPDAIVNKTVADGQFEPFTSAMEKTIKDEREGMEKEYAEKWNTHSWPLWEDNYRDSDPVPLEESYTHPENGFEDELYQKEFEEWEERRQEAEAEAKKEYIREQESNAPWAENAENIEIEIAAQKRREREAQETGTVAKVSSQRPPHPHFTTGEPCYCTFAMQEEATPHYAKLPMCEVCGDPLEHGQCKRCDWGQWSNSMGDGDQNPTDPTREFHPSIQASNQDLPQGQYHQDTPRWR